MAFAQIIPQSISRTENSRNENKSTPAMHSPATLSKNLNRLISAAVVSPRFRHLLFSDPIAALAAGYNGESFTLTPAEYAAVTSLRVNTVRDFAAQLLHVLEFAGAEEPRYATEIKADYRFGEVGFGDGTKTNVAGEKYRGSYPAHRYEA
jgi:hypothetical protein